MDPNLIKGFQTVPGPYPQAIWIEDAPNGAFSIYFEKYFWTGKTGHRAGRVATTARRLKAQTWRCLWCRNDLPVWRRADAKYCCEGCRKRAARARIPSTEKVGEAAQNEPRPIEHRREFVGHEEYHRISNLRPGHDPHDARGPGREPPQSACDQRHEY